MAAHIIERRSGSWYVKITLDREVPDLRHSEHLIITVDTLAEACAMLCEADEETAPVPVPTHPNQLAFPF